MAPRLDFAAPPDMTAIIDGAKARSNSLVSAAWANASGIGQPAAQAAPQIIIQQGPQQQGIQQQGYAGMAQYGQQSPTLDAAPGDDDWAARGLGSNVPRSLIGTESGGNFGASNNVSGAGGNGHFGFLQFSRARLNEAIAAGAIPQMSPEQYLRDENAQIASANWHFNDIDNRIRKAGFDQMIGQTIGGAPISWNGMRSMAHLGGFGGLTRYMNSGGSYNPADAYGTSLRKYAITHRG